MRQQFYFIIISLFLLIFKNLNQQVIFSSYLGKILVNACSLGFGMFYIVFSPAAACDTISGNCNIFGNNCVVCALVFDPSNECERITRCSCYYCCEEQYKEYCPQGCKDCIADGTGGCGENNGLSAFSGCFNPASDIFYNSEIAFTTLQKVTEVRMTFEKIDADRDGFISKGEAIQHLTTSNPLNMTTEQLTTNSSWFDVMDKNGNQKIEPEEFDKSLAKE